MDGNGFDELTRRLATGQTRRSVLRGLVGGGAALVAARAGGAVIAAPQDKITICHWSEDLGYYELISVSENAVPAHTAHPRGLDIIGPDFASIETCGDCNVACYDVDLCTPAACIEGSCNAYSNCGEGEICGAEGCEAIVPSCADVQLAGYPGNSLAYGVCVDDYLDIYVNGGYVTTATGCMAPISLGPLQTGDEIYLELGDYFPPCTLEPIQLLCGDTGAVLQQLNAVGHCSGRVCGNGTDDWGGNGICYSEAFTVNF
jgi:hypothetical protein